MSIPHRLRDIATIDGYTIGRCSEDLYVINPDGLMTWPNESDLQPDANLGFPGLVPRSVVLFVMRILESKDARVRPIRLPHFLTESQDLFQKQELAMSQQAAWLFPGQGSHEIAMGSALKSVGGYFDESFEMAEQLSGLALRDCVARGPEETLTQTDHAQPAIIALSTAYVDFLRDHGMNPHAVAGHSLGELAALYAAGVLQKEDAIRLAAIRGKLMSESADGTMVAVKGLNAADVQRIVEATGSKTLVVANLNTPEQTVVSGDVSSVEQFETMLRDAGHRFVRLNVSGAWHSPLVAAAAEKFKVVLDEVTWHAPTSDVFIGAVGEKVSDAEQIHEIMTRQITSPVYWHKTIESIIGVGVRDFLEVGPGKVLRGLMRVAVAKGIDYEIRGVDNKRFIKRVSESGGTLAS